MKPKRSMDRRLGTYLTLGVGAGVLGSQSSHAAIVYWDITSFTVTTGNVGWVAPLTGASGTGAFPFPVVGIKNAANNYVYSFTEPSVGSAALLAFSSGNRTTRFLGGETIGISLNFMANWSYVDNTGWTEGIDPWNTGADGASGFVGFSFDNAGTPNYGWFELTYNDVANTVVIGDFAYEDTGASILAGATGVPEPSSLGLLALGATGLLARRRRQAA